MSARANLSYNLLILLVLTICPTGLWGQSLIVNEVSQGTGSEEYVELLVVGTPDCSSDNCLDLRGWIIDDNNGDFAGGSGTGIATGAVRFDPSNNFWECVPFGTLIVIYNETSPNSSLPNDDVLLNDGNCVLVIPANSSLLEGHSSSPSQPTGTSYPTTGWSNASDWSMLGMSNGNDSFQTRDPANTSVPVHAISWGNNNGSNIIYFSGSASGSVFSMSNATSNDPADQTNFSSGTVPADETPGTGNSVQNTAFINSMNNSCSPILPFQVSATTGGDACSCTGTGSATGSGSIPNYTFEWYDGSWSAIGQSSANATGLCAGTYYVIGTSSVGCLDTAQIDLGGNCCTGMEIVAQDDFEYTTTIADLDPSAVFHVTPQTFNAHTGARSAYLNFQNGFQGIAFDRSYTVCQGHTYRLSAWFANAWGAAIEVDFHVRVLDAANNVIYEELSIPVGNWVQFVTPDFAAPTTTIKLQVLNNIPGGVGNNDGVMDDIVLERCLVPIQSYTAASMCDSDGPVNLFDDISSDYSSAGSWTGPSALANGSQGTFDPAASTPGTYTYTISPGGACPDSVATVDVAVDPSGNAGTGATLTLCSTDIPVDLFTLLTNSPDLGGAWSPILTSGTGLFDPATDPSGIYSYTITGTGACADVSADVDVTVTTQLDATITLTGPYCETDAPVNLTAASSGGTWTGIGITDAVAGTFDPSLVGGPNSTITYQITGACGDTDTEVFNVQSVVDAGTNGTATFCALDGQANLIDSLGGTPNAGGIWSPLLNSGTDVFDPSLDGTGTYLYTVSGGVCPFAVAQVDVVVNQVSDATITTTGPYCETSSLETLSANSLGGTWTGAGITDPVAGTFDPSAVGAGFHPITYEILGACGDISNVNVEVVAFIDPTIVTPADMCEDTLAFNMQSVNPGGTWSGGGITDPVNGTFDPAVAGPGGASITYAFSGTCAVSSTINFNVNAVMVPVVSGSSILCENDPAEILQTTIPGGVWSGSGVDAVTGSFDPAMANTGNNEIIYTLSGMCAGADTIIVSVRQIPTATISLADTIGCLPHSVELNYTSPDDISSCIWTISDGQTINQCPPVSATLFTEGCFDVQVLIESGAGCQALISSPNQICGVAQPNASFTADGIGVNANPWEVTLTNESSDFTSGLWYLDGQVIPDPLSSYAFTDVGVYPICLLVSNDIGCTDSTCRTVEIEADPIFFIPNSFTPDEDGHNDVFFVTHTDFEPEEYVFELYDRWGGRFLETDDLNFQWDGTIQGKKAPVGTYVWRIRYKFSNEAQVNTQTGHVNLIR